MGEAVFYNYILDSTPSFGRLEHLTGVLDEPTKAAYDVDFIAWGNHCDQNLSPSRPPVKQLLPKPQLLPLTRPKSDNMENSRVSARLRKAFRYHDETDDTQEPEAMDEEGNASYIQLNT